MMSDSSDEETPIVGDQIRVRFVTQHKEYRNRSVSSSTIAVPTQLGKKGLSKVVNHLLDLKPQIPFDFLIVEKETLVRSKLIKHIDRLQLSKEAVLELEYAPALEEPNLGGVEKFPDWVSSLDARKTFNEAAVVVSGCYDGFVQVSLSRNGKEVQVVDRLGGHKAAVKSVSHFGSSYIASGSKDGVVKLFNASLEQKKKSVKLNQEEITSCEGHNGSVETVDGVCFGSHAIIASAGWDKTVCIWKIRLDEEDNDPTDDDDEGKPLKSRKTSESSEKKIQKQITQPGSKFVEHTDNVSCLAWGTLPIVYSGSWDKSIRAWDVTRESCITQLNGNKVITSLTYNSGKQLLASAHADNCVRLWDSRTVGDAVVKLRLESHSGWVSCARWNPENPNLLVSSSHDKTLKIWDVRSTVPMYTVSSQDSKLLAVDWDVSGKYIFSAGADSMVHSHTLESHCK